MDEEDGGRLDGQGDDRGGGLGGHGGAEMQPLASTAAPGEPPSITKGEELEGVQGVAMHGV